MAISHQSNHEKILNNRYAIGNRLGVGGFSAVYSVTDNYSDYYGDERPLAVKLPLEHLSTKSDIDAFMYSEYAHLSRLSHPNIIKVMDFGIDGEYNLPYLILEKMDGTLLSELDGSQLNENEKTKIVITLLQTVAYVHACGVVHADINPQNVMLLKDGTLRLFDFGISLNYRLASSFELNYAALKAFNPLYAAPEVLKGSKPTFQSDLFSLGTVIYELYHGRLPYSINSIELRDQPINRWKLKMKIPRSIKKWLLKSLQTDPEKRIYYK